MKTTTKKEIASLVRISSDAFGKNFEIDTTSEYDSKFALIATRESLKSEIKINFNGVKTTAYMNSSSKNEFISSVYDAIERISNDSEKAKLLINEKNEQHWRHLVLHLSQIAAEKGITHQAIADELGMKRSNVSRFFAGNQCPTLRTFCAIARVVIEYDLTCC